MLVPYYEDESCVLYHGDCLEVMADLGENITDIVVTSPPYNMGLVSGGGGKLYKHRHDKSKRFTNDGYSEAGDDALIPEEYNQWQREVIAATSRAAIHGVFYNHRPRVVGSRFNPPLDGDYGIDNIIGFDLRQIIIWDQKTGIDVSLRQFCTRQEWIMLFAWPTFSLVDHSASGMGDVWNLGKAPKSDHPAPFPVSLPERCIGASGARTVLDPFAGSGTTLRAAKNLGIKAIGIEKSETFCEMTVERLRQESLFAPHQPEPEHLTMEI